MPYLASLPDAPPLSDRLSLLRLRATLAACAEGPLPTAFGTTLHGALGRALKLTACAFPDPARRPCEGCHLLDRCPYPRLFEPRHHPHRGQTPPPALLLAPAATTPGRLTPGATLQIELALVGRAAHALPLVLVVLGQMVEAGLGPLRVPCTIIRVDALDAAGAPCEAVQIGARIDGRMPAPLPWSAWEGRASAMTGAGAASVRVRTRVRLQREGAVTRRPPSFVELARALVRRADALARAHCGEADPFPDPQGWLRAAESVRLAESRLVWQQHERRSASTGHAMPLDGFVGALTYAAEPEVLAPFWPLLCLGEAIGIGRGCSFGNGRYTVRPFRHVAGPAG
jgi:hypothetical protein